MTVSRLFPDERLASLSCELAETVLKTVAYVASTADRSRADRLWPADMTVFATNPLSVAYGACGPALLLHCAGALTTPMRQWLRTSPLSVEDYPPGLYLGLAGIAGAFQTIGEPEKADEAIEALRSSPLLFAEHNLLHGTAGWGLASLRLFEQTGDQRHLNRAVLAGEHLLSAAERVDEHWYWRGVEDSTIHYGFGHGSSGIALFLAQLFQTTGSSEFRTAAIGGLEYDLAHRFESDLGWAWPRFENDTLARGYWIQGSTGIGSVALRLARALDAPKYLAIARRIADDSFVKYTVSPGQFDGMAGIAEFMLDMYRATGDNVYRERAFDLAETILWFAVERPEGTAWPGRWLNRIVHDYATGAAGIGLFFARLIRPAGRLFLDPIQAPASEPAEQPSSPEPHCGRRIA